MSQKAIEKQVSFLTQNERSGRLTKHQLVNMYPTKHGHTHCLTTNPQSILLFPLHPPAPDPPFAFDPFPPAPPPVPPFAPSPFPPFNPPPPTAPTPDPPLTILTPAGILLVTHSLTELLILVVVPTTIQAMRGREGPRRRRVREVAGQQMVWRERRRRRVEGRE